MVSPAHEFARLACDSGMFRKEPTGEWSFTKPEDIQGQFRITQRENDKRIGHVGSVGESRDGDPRACYVLFKEDAILFRRIDYDDGFDTPIMAKLHA